MKKASIPLNEDNRLKALYRYNILDTLPEEEYDAITKIASQICNTPIALISLIDPTRQWFKSHHGLGATETPRDFAFCAHSIHNPDELFIIPDATKDERFYDNPLTIDNPNVIFYAGAPLNTSDGYSLGTLCVIDTKPRKTLSDDQQETLKALAKQVMSQFELRRKNIKLEKSNNEVLRLNDQLSHFAYRLTHDLKTPIRGINSLTDFLKEDHINLFKNTEAEKWIDLISSRAVYMDSLIEEILEYTKVTNANIDFVTFNIQELVDKIIKNGDFHSSCKLNTASLNCEIVHSKIGFIQVFQNLLTNSIKFNDKEICEVTISFKEEKGFYNFVYQDNGPGIPKRFREKVFVMFETLDENNSQNTGIGLATVKSIIERLEGEIYLKDNPKQEGVYFEFKIPVQISSKEN